MLGTIAAIAGIASAAKSLLGGSGSKSYGGTQTTTRSIPPATSQQSTLFNDWFNQLYGGNQTSGISGSSGGTPSPGASGGTAVDSGGKSVPVVPDHVYIRNLNTSSPYYGKVMDMGPAYTVEYKPVRDPRTGEITNMKQVKVPNPYLSARGNFERLGTGADLGATTAGVSGSAVSTNENSLLQKLQEDEAAKKAADKAFAQRYGEASQPYRSYLQNLLSQGNPTPVTVSLGDFSTPFLTGTQRRMQNLGLKANADILANKLGEAGVLNTIAQTHTPNVAALSYFRDWLNPLYQAEQNRRYGVAGTTQTGSMNMPGPSPLQQLTGWTNLAKSGMQAWNQWQGLLNQPQQINQPQQAWTLGDSVFAG